MFNFLRTRKTKEDREKELKKLEKKTAKKVKKLRKEEEKLSAEQKRILNETKIITFTYLTFLCLFFIINLIAGLIFSVVSAPIVYLCFRKKYPQHAKIFPLLSICVIFCFFSIRGGDLLNAHMKRKNYERQVSYNTNVKEQVENTQKMLELFFELYELQGTDGEKTE